MDHLSCMPSGTSRIRHVPSGSNLSGIPSPTRPAVPSWTRPADCRPCGRRDLRAGARPCRADCKCHRPLGRVHAFSAAPPSMSWGLFAFCGAWTGALACLCHTNARRPARFSMRRAPSPVCPASLAAASPVAAAPIVPIPAATPDRTGAALPVPGSRVFSCLKSGHLIYTDK